MSVFERWFIRISLLLTGGSGVVHAFMLYLLDPPDEFAVVNHPWQPHVQHLHVLTAPLLVFAIGLIWKDHALSRRRDGRGTGLGMVMTFWPMVISGYCAQISVAPAFRSFWQGIHVGAAALWLIAALAHFVAAWRRRRLSSDVNSRKLTTSDKSRVAEMIH